MTECSYCKAHPVKDPTIILYRINEKGITGIWICKKCYDDCIETDEETNKPIFLHSNECGGFCDYACNNQGEKQAEQLIKSIG